mmetsp:Transcript_80894/g.174842  ORF Transcript_80894/g.174842 Transcript_80894/m.174842 type:complete len:96 (+) Transcript_80894:552-839(+)
MIGVFFFDIFLSFFVTYKDSTEMFVKNRVEIINNYLSTWFLIDFVASFPWNTVSKSFNGDVNLKSMNLLRMIRIFRLVKIFRTIKGNDFTKILAK